MNFILCFVICALLALTACGQTGQLELPPAFTTEKSTSEKRIDKKSTDASDEATQEKSTQKPAQ